MPSPIAHSLAGLALGRALAPPALRSSGTWYACVLLAANAPDLDFVAGAAIGHVNWLHGGPTHSLGAALVFASVAALVAGIAGQGRARMFVALGAVYASHVVLDLFSGFPDRPSRLALLWPFSTERFAGPWQPLAGILHGNRAAGLGTFLRELLLPHNLKAYGVEMAVFLPLVGLSCLFARSSPPDDRPGKATSGRGRAQVR